MVRQCRSGQGAPCRSAAGARIVFGFILLVHFCTAAVAEPARSELALVTQAGERFALQVEIANTDAEKSQGLMFRDKLDEKHGMLFLYQPSREVAIWMKNTLLPLDIIFIDVTGRIIKIERDAVPLSEQSMRSDRPVRAVLEINGGMTGFMGVAVGDRVVYEPLWPDPGSP